MVIDAINALREEAQHYSEFTLLWMRIMAISFFAGIIFAPWKISARFVVAIPVVTIVGLIIAKIVFPDVSRSTSGAVLHVIFWPLIYYGIWNFSKRKSGSIRLPNTLAKKAYPIWFVWVTFLVVASLILDVKYLIQNII